MVDGVLCMELPAGMVGREGLLGVAGSVVGRWEGREESANRVVSVPSAFFCSGFNSLEELTNGSQIR